MAVVVKADLYFPLFVGFYVRIPVEGPAEVGFTRKFVAVIHVIKLFRGRISVVEGLPYSCPVGGVLFAVMKFYEDKYGRFVGDSPKAKRANYFVPCHPVFVINVYLADVFDVVKWNRDSCRVCLMGVFICFTGVVCVVAVI